MRHLIKFFHTDYKYALSMFRPEVTECFGLYFSHKMFARQFPLALYKNLVSKNSKDSKL